MLVDSSSSSKQAFVVCRTAFQLTTLRVLRQPAPAQRQRKQGKVGIADIDPLNEIVDLNPNRDDTAAAAAKPQAQRRADDGGLPKEPR